MEDKTKRSRVMRSSDEDLKLTQGEKLLLWRRRKNWNQNKAARFFKISVFSYKLAEYSKLKNFNYAALEIDLLLPHERCLIYRKRSGKKQKQIAQELNIGNYWMRLQETGKTPCNKLLEYWEAKTK